jgi:hypothetical protein
VAPRDRRIHLVWIGPILTFVAVVSYFTTFARFPALRDVPWLNLPLAAAGAIASVVGVRAAFGRPGGWRRIAGAGGLALSLVLCGLFGAYVYFLSYAMPGPTERTTALDRVPDVTLVDHRGQSVSLADFRGRKVVLTFYRGHW